MIDGEKPRWWVFTFGTGHRYAGRFVRVPGTFAGARAAMRRKFGNEWGFQYTQEQWDRISQNLRMNGIEPETEMEVDWDGEEAQGHQVPVR